MTKNLCYDWLWLLWLFWLWFYDSRLKTALKKLSQSYCRKLKMIPTSFDPGNQCFRHKKGIWEKKLLVAWVEICPLPKKYYQLWLLPMFTNSAIFDSIVRVKTNPGLLWSCSNLLCDWSKKYRATLSTNPMQNKHQSKFGRPRFPAL